MAETTPVDEYEWVGLVVDDIQFIPADIVRKHLPFVTPPGRNVYGVYRRVDDD